MNLKPRNFCVLILLTILFTFYFETAKTEKILVVAFLSSKSHKNVWEPLIQELAKKGHQVTVVSPIKVSKPIKNIRDVVIPGYDQMMAEAPNLFEMKERGENVNPLTIFDMLLKPCHFAYQHPPVLELLNEKFDLVMYSATFNECAYPYMAKFNTTTIGIVGVAAPFWIVQNLGGPTPPSFVPNVFSPYNDKMTFMQRVINYSVVKFIGLVQQFYMFPKCLEVAKQYLGDDIIEVDEFVRNTSLVLANAHYTLNYPRPLMPDIIDVGGMHCRDAQQLPKDLDDFLKDTDKHGFIYFSMGSAVQANTMPEKYRKAFVATFAKLAPIKNLWKWESDDGMKDLPKNVKLGKWLPQQDILGHKNIRLFFTHGGLLSTEEAVYHGVPLVGIPMMGDQDLNMRQSETNGFAVTLQFNDISEENVLRALNKVLNNPQYKERVQDLSKVFKDRPQKPLDTAVYWTEYILKHKGALHFRSPARDLNSFQYHSPDVIAFLIGILVLVLLIIRVVIKFIWRKMCGSSNSKTSIKKKKN